MTRIKTQVSECRFLCLDSQFIGVAGTFRLSQPGTPQTFSRLHFPVRRDTRPLLGGGPMRASSFSAAGLVLAAVVLGGGCTSTTDPKPTPTPSPTPAVTSIFSAFTLTRGPSCSEMTVRMTSPAITGRAYIWIECGGARSWSTWVDLTADPDPSAVIALGPFSVNGSCGKVCTAFVGLELGKPLHSSGGVQSPP